MSSKSRQREEYSCFDKGGPTYDSITSVQRPGNIPCLISTSIKYVVHSVICNVSVLNTVHDKYIPDPDTA